MFMGSIYFMLKCVLQFFLIVLNFLIVLIHFTLATPLVTPPVARNYIFSLIWRCYGPKRDVLDYWGTIVYWLLSY